MRDPLYALARAILFHLDAERAHHAVLRGAALAARSRVLCALARLLYAPPPDPRLSQRLFGLDFPSPIGLAAGLDKDGVAIDLWAALGFGFVEVGTVTPGQGQPGNDRPRLWRLPAEGALVNRMGFNNLGADALARRLAARRSRIPIGANIGKAKATPLEQAGDDYASALRAVFPHVDYVAINVSSPNTPGLRDLQAVDALGPLVARIVEENQRLAAEVGGGARPRPLLLKISPDLADEDLDRIADLAVERGLDGLIATNTTVRPPQLPLAPPMAGGVSGRPLRPRALECTRRLRARLGGRLPIVGVGGIESGDDLYERLAAGASLAQVYTAFVLQGPALLSVLTRDLVARLHREGYSTVVESVGCNSTPRSAN
ncbi:MAG: quinone-dependent dihydroorotate dehydrogenase [Deltaproteobacteria bacterium]|nr:quinone-dependent dihydroorotate dehydrogenase [Deltaproteobacteria bacterium]